MGHRTPFGDRAAILLKRIEEIMGTAYEIRCGKCGYKDLFRLGVGMMYFSLQNVLDNLHYTKRDEIRKLLDTYSIENEYYAHELFVCPKCNRLFERFFVQFNYDQNKTFKTEYRCTKCKSKLKRISIDQLNDYPCHICGSKNLKYCEILMWD